MILPRLNSANLILERVLDGLVVLDVLLRPVDDPDDAELDWNDSTAQDIDGVSAYKKLHSS